jgi:hypothetical protein
MLTLTSPTSGGRSVDIVHLRTKATEFSFLINNISLKWVSLALSAKEKRQWREADHSPPSGTWVKNGEIYFRLAVCVYGVVLN